jgi:ribonuclease HI
MSKRKFYAVVEGRRPGIYDEWFGPEGAEAQIKGFANAVYKGFVSLADAEGWFTNIAGTPPTYMRLTGPATQQTESQADYVAIQRDALTAGKIVMYTDGGCLDNPGPGGYGVVLLFQDRRKELSGGYAMTTNNRMELMACIAGLRALKQRRSVVLFSDSSYVVNGIQKGWARRWRENGWKRKEGDVLAEVKNADLWGQLLALCEAHEVEFVQVKGHAGIAENERCDQLSTAAMRRARLPPDPGFESTEA